MKQITKNILAFLGKFAVLILTGFSLVFVYAIAFLFLTVDYYFASFAFLLPILALFVAWFITNEKGRKKALLSAGALTIAAVLTMGVIFGRDQYLRSIRIVDDSNIQTERYIPFDPNNELPTLDKEASLKFKVTEKLPIVDGAAALFPMYSSFVQATYPSNIKELNHEDSPYKYHNTHSGYLMLIDGYTDIFFGAYPSEEQLAYAKESSIELEFIPMGREGFVFFTNVKNPVSSLTQQEIKDIYSGKTTNWKDVGGENSAILAYQRNKSSGSQSALERFMGNTPLMTPPTDLVSDLMSGIISIVSDYHNHKGAMGFSFYTYANELQANKNIKMLAVDGVSPTTETIGNGTYPITESFYMVVRKDHRTENVNKLIDWVLSSQGQELVAKSGYTPIN